MRMKKHDGPRRYEGLRGTGPTQRRPKTGRKSGQIAFRHANLHCRRVGLPCPLEYWKVMDPPLAAYGDPAMVSYTCPAVAGTACVFFISTHRHAPRMASLLSLLLLLEGKKTAAPYGPLPPPQQQHNNKTNPHCGPVATRLRREPRRILKATPLTLPTRGKHHFVVVASGGGRRGRSLRSCIMSDSHKVMGPQSKDVPCCCWRRTLLLLLVFLLLLLLLLLLLVGCCWCWLVLVVVV